ncbi:hypothetical protein LIA77_09039 [Sarocladium implicatum]|nr:hypothetical protein LIA77_09039 [Sarocladium implicatum]
MNHTNRVNRHPHRPPLCLVPGILPEQARSSHLMASLPVPVPRILGPQVNHPRARSGLSLDHRRVPLTTQQCIWDCQSLNQWRVFEGDLGQLMCDSQRVCLVILAWRPRIWHSTSVVPHLGY